MHVYMREREFYNPKISVLKGTQSALCKLESRNNDGVIPGPKSENQGCKS